MHEEFEELPGRVSARSKVQRLCETGGHDRKRAVVRGLMMLSISAFAVSVVAVGGARPAHASPPQQLYNKAVTLSWTHAGTGRRQDGQTITFNNSLSLIVYVSSAGRLFQRWRSQASGKKGIGREKEVGPGESGSRASLRFQGNQMIGVVVSASGARQFVITFDQSFSSCSLSIADARAGGATIRRRGPDGAMYDLLSVTTGSPTCSIGTGNPFG